MYNESYSVRTDIQNCELDFKLSPIEVHVQSYVHVWSMFWNEGISIQAKR